MPLENVTVDEIAKVVNGNALDNEVRQFEGASQEVHKDVTQVKETQQQTSSSDNKLGEKNVETQSKEDKSKVVDIKAFDALIGSNLATLDKKGVEKSKVEETKIDEDSDDEKEIKSSEDIKLDENGKPIRDLEGFGEQEKVWLKRMPYESYKHFSTILREKKESETKYKTEKDSLVAKITNLESGKEVLPESYYDNPNAFILSPEFGKIQHAAQLSKTVENHWTEQLRKFKKGETWTPLTNDPKTGEIVYDEDREFNADDEVYILKQLSGAEKQLTKWSSELERFVGGFQENHKNYISKVKQAEKEMLPSFENKESNEYKTYEAVKPTIEKWGIRKDNPAFDFVAKAVALNLIFKDALTGMIAEQNKNKTIKSDQVKAGPTASSFSGGGSSNNNSNKEKPKFSDFEKLLRNDTF